VQIDKIYGDTVCRYLSSIQFCTYLQYPHLFCQSVPQHQSVFYLPTVSPSILSICSSAPMSVVPTYTATVSPSILSICTSAPIRIVPTYSISIYFVNLYLSTNQNCTYLQYPHLFCQSVPQHQSVLYLSTVSPSILSICTSAPISVVLGTTLIGAEVQIDKIDGDTVDRYNTDWCRGTG
jgi:hypothetical protein